MVLWLRRLVPAVAGVGALAALYAVFMERVRVGLDFFTLRVERPGLPAEGLTILHLSDLHFRGASRVQARKIARLNELIAGLSYDIAVITGDFIHDASGFPVALDFVRGLRPRLAAYSCPGNHDYCESSLWGIFGPRDESDDTAEWRHQLRLKESVDRLRDFIRKVRHNERVHLPLAYHDVPAMHASLQAAGIQPLVNQSAHLFVDGVDVWIAGVDDAWEGRPDLAAALRDVPESAALILLAHNPDIWLDPCAERADLVLSGHVHGGQVSLPLLGAVHTQGTHLSRRRPDGWFVRGQSHLFVSRGLGESLPFRFGAPPHIALIRLLPARPVFA